MSPATIERLSTLFRDDAQEGPARLSALGQLLVAYEASVAQDDDTHRRLGDAVYRLLDPHARPLAVKQSRQLPQYVQGEFVQEALVRLFVQRDSQGRPRICGFDTRGATLGQLRAWMGQVFMKHRLTVYRQLKRVPEHQPLGEEHGSARSGPTDSCVVSDEQELLGHEDVARLAALSVKTRVKLVAITLAWGRLPEGVWDRWLSEYARVCHVVLARPCPPESLRSSPNTYQFFQGLATALKTTVGSLHGVFYHQLPRLREELEYLGE